MELKPGYKQTEVGVIPEEWQLVPFSELLDFRNGVNADKSAYGKGVRFINVLEPITYSHIRASDIPGRVYLSKSATDSYAVHYGDLVFNRTSETQEEVGLSAVYCDEEPVVFGGFVIRGRPKNGSLDPSYSGYGFRSPTIRSQIIARGQGAIRANIGQADLRQVLAPVPPLPEQRAIAEALGDIDALLGALTQLIAKKRDLKQAAMQQLLTGHQRLTGFSGQWSTYTFGELFDLLRNASNSRADLVADGEVGYLHYGDIHIHSSQFFDCGRDLRTFISADKVRSTPLMADGDLVMVDASEDTEAIGKAVEITGHNGFGAVAGLHTLLLRAKGDRLADGFKGYLQYFSAVREALVRMATGVSVYGISKSNVRTISLAVPDIDEQKAIAAVLSDMEAEITALEARLAKTRDLKQGMMQELLTGRTRLV